MNSTSQTRGGASIFNESWESQVALDRHLATPHFERLKQSSGELVKEPFEVNIAKAILPGAAADRFSEMAKAGCGFNERRILKLAELHRAAHQTQGNRSDTGRQQSPHPEMRSRDSG
jgi:hypothetical protein